MTDSPVCYVVGSGPAGIACAMALAAAHKKVVILDSGVSLESERQSAIVKLAGMPADEWNAEATASLRSGMTGSSSGIPLKLAYGSDYPYRTVPGATEVELAGPDTRPSYAVGGLSNVWGSAVMPYRQSDIEGWPIQVADLEEGYRAVLKWMPLSAEQDGLSEFFPLYREPVASLTMSRQAANVLGTLQRNAGFLKKQGVFFGRSRLAVHTRAVDFKPACVECGLCMYGCPHGLIYSTSETLTALIAAGKVTYQAGVTVQRVAEAESGVVIHAIDMEGKSVTFHGDRVFLGAGVLNTTTILLRSLDRYDAEVPIHDSQYFLLPALRFGGTDNVVRERLHTLAQLFLEIFDQSISPHTIHLQTYTYNDLFLEPILGALGPLKSVFPLESFVGRLILFQGYLHSAHSSPIGARLTRDGGKDVLKLTSSSNAESKRRVGRIASKLLRLSRHTGVMPLRPMLKMGKPGRGFHSGGSFPMSRTPKALETDIYGRPPGLKRVHAIDSSVLPSIAATTITLTVMANAYRIGASHGSE